jgi:hypothetical protein
VEAVTGFEKNKGGKSHPVISGVLTWEKNFEPIMKVYQENLKKAKIREKEKLKKESKTIWRKVGLLNKLYS